MRAKLLKILRRDAERAIRLKHGYGTYSSYWFKIYKKGMVIWTDVRVDIHIGVMEDFANCKLTEYRRGYILEKLEKLKN